MSFGITTKPGARAPGVCLLSCVPCNSREQVVVSCARIVVGAAGAGTWGQVSSGTFRWVRGT